MLRAFILFAGLCGVVAFPVAAQLRPASLPEIFDSYNDCFAATPADGLAPVELEKKGWSRATISDHKGNSSASDLVIFGHSDRKPIIMLNAESGNGICIVITKLESREDYKKFLSAFGGKLPKPDKSGTINFLLREELFNLLKPDQKNNPQCAQSS